MEHTRKSPLDIPKEEFRAIGYRLIDSIADFIETIGQRPVTRAETSRELQIMLGQSPMPDRGIPAEKLIGRATELLLNHSLLNGHPKFMGYITSPAAPIAALADLLAAAVNPNVGAQILSPMATEIERQTISWLAEFIGLPPGYSGLLVSGGNMANFTGFLAAITAKTPAAFREDGLAGLERRLIVYCSGTTHTWIDKAAKLSGLGTRSIRWIKTDAHRKMDTWILEDTLKNDIENGHKPIMVVGTAGDVSTGAVDDLKAIAEICKKYDLWFHIDGAYGMPAAVLPRYHGLFEGFEAADSIALDPHKWLYSSLEAGCILVKDSRHLPDTFSSHPDYYNFDKDREEPALNYYEYGLQNSRGFRALKVWLALQQAGKRAYAGMIAEDIGLSELMFALATAHPELEALTQNLSICTFRYYPAGLRIDAYSRPGYLNELNEALLNSLQQGGEVFLSNAVLHEKYCLRSCIVNFRTSEKDVREIIDIVVREGRLIHQAIKE